MKSQKISGSIFTALLLSAGLLAAPAVFAQESTPPASSDDPFAVDFFGEADASPGDQTESGDELIEKAPESKSDKKAGLEFLKTDTVKIGGSFTGQAGAEWTSYDPWGDANLDDYGLLTTLIGTVYFDARPEEDFRVFGKFKTSWPFYSTDTFLTSAAGNTTTVMTTSDSLSVPNIQIFELFADFSWNDAVYLRFGKQTINWGVGYFFSPADVFNLGAIDIQDPTAQREGPIALRVHYPIQGTQTNLWGYAVWPSDEEDPKPEDIAAAAKVEFLVAKAWELGLGGYYRYDHAPKAMATAAGSIRDFNIFGEAVASWGSDKNYVTDVTDYSSTGNSTNYDEGIFFSGTAGFYYYDSDTELTIAAQYFYNGDGYEDADRKNLIDEVQAFIASDTTGTLSSAMKYLVYQAGRHYAAASISKNELLTDNLDVSLVAIADLSDFSGYVIPTLTWEFFDYAKLSLFSTFVFGGEDTEYVVLNDGAACTLGFYFTLGTGSF